MPEIRRLRPEVVAQIAAGEVVERPASVVKELVENSLDAGASRIDIELEHGGIELIRVVDDGCGISPEQLSLAFAPHSTSKIHETDDLLQLLTLGFRGEALASIAGIAQVQIQSRLHTADVGYELRCAGAQLGELRQCHGAVGTRIEVRHLFFNVPVRKTFLKSTATELGHISEVLTRIALSHPTVHFVLRHNGKQVYEIPGTAGLKNRIGLFFDAEVEDNLYDVDSGPAPMRVRGWIADPKVNKGNAKYQYFFVNGRWFRDRSLGHAFQEAYRGLLMTGRYPVGFLFLDLPPHTVDFNVHPQKHEVRFRDQSSVYSLLRSSIKSRLLKEQLIPSLELPTGEVREAIAPRASFDLASLPESPFRQRTMTEPIPQSPRQREIAATAPPWEVVVPPLAAEQPVEEVPLPFPIPDVPRGSALQVHDAYLVVETPAGMLVIDQHALHERILYEQLRQRVRTGKLEVQRLLIPEALELPPLHAAAVLEVADELGRLGLDVSDFGGNTILLSSYPTLLSRRAPAAILRGVIDELIDRERLPNKEALFDHLLATMACKAAVKAGDKLTQEEIDYLLQLRELAEDSHHCPHGRPTSLVFSRAQLDKQFGRI